MPELRIFRNSEGDCVVAADPTDALIVMAEWIGYPNPADYQHDTGEMPSDWTPLQEAKLTIEIEDEGKVTKHTSVWVAENGRGYLCGTNY